MRHTSILALLAALFLTAPVASRADEPDAEPVPVRRSTGEVGPVVRAIDRHVEAFGKGVRLYAFRLTGDIQLQVGVAEEDTLTAFRRAVATDPAILGYLARDAVESTLVQGGRSYTILRFPAAEKAAFVPPPGDGLNVLDAYRRIEKLARQAKLSVNPDLWKRKVATLPDGGRSDTVTMQVIAWGAAERDFADLVAKDPDLCAVGAIERDARATPPHAISEEPSVAIQWRQPSRR